MWGKPKKYDPNKLETHFRVMVAEMKVAQKKQRTLIDNYERVIVNSVRRKDKKEIYDKAYKIAECKALLNGYDLIADAIKNIRENKDIAIPSRKGPDPSVEDSFRIICCAAQIVKLEHFTKFWNEVRGTSMFDKGVGADLGDRTKCDERVEQYFLAQSHEEEEIVSIIKDVGEHYLDNLDQLESVLGFKLTEQQQQPSVNVQYPQQPSVPGYPPQQQVPQYPPQQQVPPGGFAPYPQFQGYPPTVGYPPSGPGYPPSQPFQGYPMQPPAGVPPQQPQQPPSQPAQPPAGLTDIKDQQPVEHEDLFTPMIDLPVYTKDKWPALIQEISDAVA